MQVDLLWLRSTTVRRLASFRFVRMLQGISRSRVSAVSTAHPNPAMYKGHASGWAVRVGLPIDIKASSIGPGTSGLAFLLVGPTSRQETSRS